MYLLLTIESLKPTALRLTRIEIKVVHNVILPISAALTECDANVKIKKALSAGNTLLIKYQTILNSVTLECFKASYSLDHFISNKVIVSKCYLCSRVIFLNYHKIYDHHSSNQHLIST